MTGRFGNSLWSRIPKRDLRVRVMVVVMEMYLIPQTILDVNHNRPPWLRSAVFFLGVPNIIFVLVFAVTTARRWQTSRR